MGCGNLNWALPILVWAVYQMSVSSNQTEPKLHQHIVDAEKLPSNAVWRFRQEGDVFSPLGLGGSKKLKEYFIDKKVPQRMRNEIPVLASGDKILAVADIEIADEIKVTPETKRYYKINYEKDLM